MLEQRREPFHTEGDRFQGSQEVQEQPSAGLSTQLDRECDFHPAKSQPGRAQNAEVATTHGEGGRSTLNATKSPRSAPSAPSPADFHRKPRMLRAKGRAPIGGKTSKPKSIMGPTLMVPTETDSPVTIMNKSSIRLTGRPSTCADSGSMLTKTRS